MNTPTLIALILLLLALFGLAAKPDAFYALFSRTASDDTLLRLNEN